MVQELYIKPPAAPTEIGDPLRDGSLTVGHSDHGIIIVKYNHNQTRIVEDILQSHLFTKRINKQSA